MITTERTVKEDGSFVETTTMEQSSIVIKRNAKGEFAWDMKIYKDHPADYATTAVMFLERIAKTIDTAKELQL